MQNRPPPGTMVWWRWKPGTAYYIEPTWNFGYCTYVSGHDMLRMGVHNQDTNGGAVVSINEIEWRPYKVGG